MNKPIFGILAAAAIFTTVIFAQTKPPVSTFTDSRGGKTYKTKIPAPPLDRFAERVRN